VPTQGPVKIHALHYDSALIAVLLKYPTLNDEQYLIINPKSLLNNDITLLLLALQTHPKTLALRLLTALKQQLSLRPMQKKSRTKTNHAGRLRLMLLAIRKSFSKKALVQNSIAPGAGFQVSGIVFSQGWV
jgi:hypothetical protein